MTNPTQNLLPFPELQFFDGNGEPLANGQVFTFAADGTTPKATYQDPNGATPNSNPIILDSSGRALIYGTGQYVWTVYDQASVLQYNQPSADPTALLNVSPAMLPVIQASSTAEALTLLGGASSINSLPVGLGPLPWGGSDSNIPSGWLLCYGQAVSRSTYALLFAAIGTLWGVGDGTTTFNLPDMRGKGVFGADAMGGTPANILTTASIGVTAIPGVLSGDQMAQTDTLTPNDPGHNHTVGNGAASFVVNGPAGTYSLNGNAFVYIVGPTTDKAFTGLSVASGLTGTKQNIPPCAIANYIIFAGV